LSVGSQLQEVLAIEVGESQAVCGVDDQVEDRPS
jgi:hypothetical protein